jgi:hypothetical protein
MTQALDVSTVTPVYLYLRANYKATEAKFLEALTALESYIVRRAICGGTAKGYNRVFLKLLEHLTTQKDPALAVAPYLRGLSGKSQETPTDEVFKERWLNRPVYGPLRAGKLAVIFRRLELGMRGKGHGSVPVPQFEKLTLEHVLPQSWQENYALDKHLDTEEARAFRESNLHTFGNLTLLTGPLNSELSNSAFKIKRPLICQSLYVLNYYFQSYGDTWVDEDIRKRGEILFETALRVWPMPKQAELVTVGEAEAGDTE